MQLSGREVCVRATADLVSDKRAEGADLYEARSVCPIGYVGVKVAVLGRRYW